jgi:transposase InsO family protein
MPWKEHRTVDLREELVLRAKAPERNVAELCREYGVSRKTAYKWLRRFDEEGVEGLKNMSKRPQTVVSTSGEMVLRIVELRHDHPTWGPKKLRIVLLRRSGSHSEVPTVRTIARILERAGEPLVRRRRRSIFEPETSEVVQLPRADEPNDLWTVDFKGWWHTRDGARAEPLTVRDAVSRFLLLVKLMRSTREKLVRKEFQRLFEKYGLPTSIRVDNGPPFASRRSRAGLSKLSAWWVSLGVQVVRGRPAHPEDNGGHERMHADMARELQDSPAATAEAQQRACDGWVETFNQVRPHEALGGKTPADVFRPSSRRYRGPRRTCYPTTFDVRHVDMNGHIRLNGRNYFVSGAVAGHDVGLELLADGNHRAWFYEVDLGVLRERNRG